MQLGIELIISGSVNLLAQFVGWQLLPRGRTPSCSPLTLREVMLVGLLSLPVGLLVSVPLLVWVNASYFSTNRVISSRNNTRIMRARQRACVCYPADVPAVAVWIGRFHWHEFRNPRQSVKQISSSLSGLSREPLRHWMLLACGLDSASSHPASPQPVQLLTQSDHPTARTAPSRPHSIPPQ